MRTYQHFAKYIGIRLDVDLSHWSFGFCFAFDTDDDGYKEFHLGLKLFCFTLFIFIYNRMDHVNNEE